MPRLCLVAIAQRLALGLALHYMTDVTIKKAINDAGGACVYAAIWDRSPGPDLVARHGMTAQDYQQAFDSLGKQGFCLSQVSGYSVASQDRYAAIWERKPCPAFVARHGMTAPHYQQAFDELGRQGFRLRLVSAYQIDGEPAYAAIWDKSPGPSFVARHGMTPDQYQKAFDQLTRDGFRLVWIDAD